MHDDYISILAAIDEIWPELPALLGDVWPDFAARIAGYRRRGEDPAQRSLAAALIFGAFGEHPAADARLHEELARQSGGYEAGKNFFRYGTPDDSPTQPTPKGLTPPAPPPLESPAAITRYTDITCPRRVWVQAPRISVIVRLTAAPSQAADVAPRALAVRTDAPVQVTIQARGFDLLSARTQSIAVDPAADSTPAVFDLKPQQTGMTTLSLDFQQGGSPLDAVTWEVEITREQVVTQEARLSHIITLDPAAAPPDLLLYVGEEMIQGVRHLRLQLFEQGQEAGRLFAPVPLPGSLQATADALLAALEQLTDTGAAVAAAVASAAGVAGVAGVADAGTGDLGVADAPAAVLSYAQRQQAELARIEAATRKLGEKLWWELIPGDFKQLYAARRSAWAGCTLLIVSDEPAIPWEMVWPYGLDATGGWEDDGPWCLTFCLTRWLRRGEHAVGASAPPAAVTVQALACVTPTDSGLAFTRREQTFLAGWRSTRGVADASPAASHVAAVRALIDQGGYDWLHVASHGCVDQALGVWQGMLVLQDGGTLDADAFLGPGPLSHLRQRRPGFFFNACHGGRQGWGLTYLAGWAPRLLELGAGVVVAPLWTVGDEQAFAFAAAFYDRLEAAGLGAAVREARFAARREGDPTWLAYSVYAHPNARVRAA